MTNATPNAAHDLTRRPRASFLRVPAATGSSGRRVRTRASGGRGPLSV